MSAPKSTPEFRRWLSQYTNGEYLDFILLPVPRQQQVWASYRRDRMDAWGEPCGKGLIDIKAVPASTTKE